MKRQSKLTPYERRIEEEAGEYIDAGREAYERVAQAIAVRKKDAVLNIRINQGDLDSLRKKAAKLGVKYQTFIAEILHRIAMS